MAGLGVDDGLVDEGEFAIEIRVAERLVNFMDAAEIGAVVGREDNRMPAGLVLGLIEGIVGVLKKVVG